MDTVVAGAGEGGVRCSDGRTVIHCCGTGGTYVWFGDVENFPTHWEDPGCISSQGGPHVDGEEDEEENGRDVDLPHAGGGGGGGEPTEGVALHRPSP